MGVKERLTEDTGISDQIQQHVDKKVTLNVGGVRHDTWLSTLEMFPGTRLALLSQLKEGDEAYDSEHREYFFDRHPKAFENILQYYRSEELHMDPSVCGNLMNKELLFWGIEESEIEPCCWAVYSKNTEHRKTLEELDDNFAYQTDMQAWEDSVTGFKKFQLKVWKFLEDPSSSRGAKIYAVMSMFFVALSIFVFVLETHKMFQIDKTTRRSMMDVEPDDPWTPTGSPLTCCCDQEFNVTSAIPVTHPALVYIDYICLAFFILEILIRFCFCPQKLKFFKDSMNVIDLICLVPYCVSITLRSMDESSSAAAVLKTFLMMRIVRILRIFKLMKHYSAFKILAYTLKVSTKELFLMVVFLMTGVLMFASLVHYIEKDNFPNIPIAIWWALVTMTTVGYGDKYPVTIPGFIVGSLCVVSGVLVIAFTVPIVVNNFSLYYSHAQTRIKAPIKRKKGEKKNIKARVTGLLRKIKNNKNETETPTSFDSLPNSSRETSGLTTDDDQKELVKTNTSRIRNRKPVASKQKVRAHANEPSDTSSELSTPEQRPVGAKANILNVEDLESLDSGYDEGHQKNNRKYEAESQKIIDAMRINDKKQDEERKRQEWLLKRKRQIKSRFRSKESELGVTPRDIEIHDATEEANGSNMRMNDINEESKT